MILLMSPTVCGILIFRDSNASRSLGSILTPSARHEAPHVSDLPEEVALLWPGFHSMMLESFEDFADFIHMLVKRLCVAKEIVQVWNIGFVPKGAQHLFHAPLQCCECVGESKWNSHPFVESPRGDEGCEMSGTLCYETLMVGFTLV